MLFASHSNKNDASECIINLMSLCQYQIFAFGWVARYSSNQFDHILVIPVAFDCLLPIAFSALVVVMSHARMYHRIDPQIFCIFFIPFLSRQGDSSGDGGVGVVRVNFVGGSGCGESCGLFGLGW